MKEQKEDAFLGCRLERVDNVELTTFDFVNQVTIGVKRRSKLAIPRF